MKVVSLPLLPPPTSPAPSLALTQQAKMLSILSRVLRSVCIFMIDDARGEEGKGDRRRLKYRYVRENVYLNPRYR